jgi:hypothetical protein
VLAVLSVQRCSSVWDIASSRAIQNLPTLRWSELWKPLCLLLGVQQWLPRMRREINSRLLDYLPKPARIRAVELDSVRVAEHIIPWRREMSVVIRLRDRRALWHVICTENVVYVFMPEKSGLPCTRCFFSAGVKA